MTIFAAAASPLYSFGHAAFIDTGACRNYVGKAHTFLAQTLAAEYRPMQGN